MIAVKRLVHKNYVALPCDATRCGTARHLRRFMNAKSRPQRAASRPTAPRRKDRNEFYPMRRDAIRRSNRVLLPIFAFHVASHARYKEIRSVKWTVRRSSLKLCARFLVCGRQLRSAIYKGISYKRLWNSPR